jgi:hypothetical protein
MQAFVRSWAAWSPGRADRDAWVRWCRAPEELLCEGAPDVGFLPPMLRRRCGPLARVMLSAACGCGTPDELAHVSTVFASRHGNVNESIELMHRLAGREALSPTRFSHTVHNAQAALFSIAVGNRHGSSSLGAGAETFACGWLEALAFLERAPERPVLLVVGDVPLDPLFAPLVEEPRGIYAAAFLLERAGAAPGVSLRVQPAERLGVSLRVEQAEPGGPALRWPDALEFLRWQLSPAARLELGGSRRRWVFEKVH